MSGVSIYLASRSPRRRQLLRQIGVSFELLATSIDETWRSGESPRAHVERLARAKANAGAALVAERRLAARPVLGADTSVVVDGEILGKPREREEAMRMLRALSGRRHLVLTAVALHSGADVQTALSESTVSFATLSQEEIAEYCETGEPFDKAGAYAIQGRAGAFVTRLEGSYSGVVGLPLHEVRMLLRRAGGRES